jgi:hypothetical protein
MTPAPIEWDLVDRSDQELVGFLTYKTGVKFRVKCEFWQWFVWIAITNRENDEFIQWSFQCDREIPSPSIREALKLPPVMVESVYCGSSPDNEWREVNARQQVARHSDT